MLGKIVAGRPTETLPQPDYVQVPLYLRTDRPCYVLQVGGDSMCEDGILDHDYVVVEQRAHANNGEIVVTFIRGDEGTLKRIVQESGKVILCPEHSALEPMEFDRQDVVIQGALVGQMYSSR